MQEKLKDLNTERSNQCLAHFWFLFSGMIPHATSPRLHTELDSKLSAFQKKFDVLLKSQAEALQFEHEPSSPLPEYFLRFLSYTYPKSISLRQKKGELRKILCELTKEDVQLNQVVSRCRLAGCTCLHMLGMSSTGVVAPKRLWHGQGSEATKSESEAESQEQDWDQQ